jgi:hypothetical protein
VDAYRNMQALGLQPSPAALTALLDQHMAREAWEAVDAALAAWAEQGGAEEGGDATVSASGSVTRVAGLVHEGKLHLRGNVGHICS